MTEPASIRPSHGGNLVWAAAVANCSPHAILDFSASINPLGPPTAAIAAIEAHLSDLKAYPDPAYRSLRAALSEFHRLPAEWILPGNGAAELLTWACRDLAAQAETWLIAPAFSDYLRALNAFRATVKQWPIAPFEPTVSTLSLDNFGAWELGGSQSLGSSPAIGVLLNNPHNPTGMVLLRPLIAALLEQFSLVVVDEAFMDFLRPDEQQSVIDWVPQFPNLVVIRSLTKFYSLPGLRLGYAIAHPDRLKRWQQWRDPWAVNALAAAVGEVVVKDAVFQQQTWDWLAIAKAQLGKGFAALPGLVPHLSAANFLLVRSHRSVTHLQTELLKQDHILIRDCLSFPELGDRYFRVAVRTESENQRLLKGLADVLEVDSDCG